MFHTFLRSQKELRPVVELAAAPSVCVTDRGAGVRDGGASSDCSGLVSFGHEFSSSLDFLALFLFGAVAAGSATEFFVGHRLLVGLLVLFLEVISSGALKGLLTRLPRHLLPDRCGDFWPLVACTHRSRRPPRPPLNRIAPLPASVWQQQLVGVAKTLL